MNRGACRAAVLVAAGFLIGGPAAAQSAGSPGSVPDLSGFWERKDETGSGSFGGTLAKLPLPALTPEVIQANRQKAGTERAGYVVSFTSKWCMNLAYPFMMQHSAPFNILQTADEIAVVPETHAAIRHIYLDGRPHPGPRTLELTSTGHAIGRWEGDTLVVDSVGFADGDRVPGGGRTSPATHLVERYRLLEGGEKLSITFSWEDPKIYLKPHTYQLIYHKMPPGTYAFEEFCDASDPKQSGSVVEPPQK
jgi:hypothetical protein